MIIPCNEINQNINELLIAFEDCNKIKNSDLRQLVDLVAAVNNCASGGNPYNNLVTENITTPGVYTYPANTFHSFSLNVMNGSILYQGFNFPTGSTRNVEYSTLNQNSVTFEVLPGGEVLFEYLTE